MSIQRLLEDDYWIVVFGSAIFVEPTARPKRLRQSQPSAWPARLINVALDVCFSGVSGRSSRTLERTAS